MYQSTTVVGNIGEDAVIRTINQQTKTISFSIAVNKKFVDADGVRQEQTTWFNCTKWVFQGGSTEVAKYLTKGTQVVVEGEVSANSYKSNADGKWHASLNLRVQSLTLLGSRKEAGDTGTGTGTAPAIDDRANDPFS